MRILVIGGTGTIGGAVVERLQEEHEVIPVGHRSGQRQADLSSISSLRTLFDAIGRVDALVCCAGNAAFGPLEDLSDRQFQLGLESKLMGQVNLVRVATPFMGDGGSITLTSGVLSQEPMPGGAAISMVNAGVEGFVRGAAVELPRGIRINAVSPPWVSETLEAMGRDPSSGLPAATVATAYVEAVHGSRNGETIDARQFA